MKKKEIIICAVVKHNDKIIRCHRHDMGLRKFSIEIPRKDLEQGFITSENRFVDRWQAFRIAKNAGQIKMILDGIALSYIRNLEDYVEK